MNEIIIDGSFGEGGGQIIRTSLSLSAITKKNLHIKNIRAKRKNPGLQPQHLMACLAVNELCDGEIQGTEKGSRWIRMIPNDIQGGEYIFDIGTAGSIVLLAQTIIPLCLYAKNNSYITLIGGTHVLQSPNYDYFYHVFLPAIRRFGIKIESKLIRTGFYPKGGGRIELEIESSHLQGCRDWKSTDTDITALIRLSSRLPNHIVERERDILQEGNIKRVEISIDDTFSPGNAITLWQNYKGACALGERGKRAEIVAYEAINAISKENGDVDAHLSDQLLIYAALAEGKTIYNTSEITNHFKTNQYIISKFLDKSISYENNHVVVE